VGDLLGQQVPPLAGYGVRPPAARLHPGEEHLGSAGVSAAGVYGTRSKITVEAVPSTNAQVVDKL
jgi:hypothetical protein